MKAGYAHGNDMNAPMSTVLEYAKQLANKANKIFHQGEIFAKVLTANDDSGRH